VPEGHRFRSSAHDGPVIGGVARIGELDGPMCSGSAPGPIRRRRSRHVVSRRPSPAAAESRCAIPGAAGSDKRPECRSRCCPANTNALVPEVRQGREAPEGRACESLMTWAARGWAPRNCSIGFWVGTGRVVAAMAFEEARKSSEVPDEEAVYASWRRCR